MNEELEKQKLQEVNEEQPAQDEDIAAEFTNTDNDAGGVPPVAAPLQDETLAPSPEAVEDTAVTPVPSPEQVQDAVQSTDALPGEGSGNTVDAIEKMFTQSQVNDLVGKTRMESRDKALRELWERYGVTNGDELDSILGRGQSYDILNDDYNGLNQKYMDVMAENALLKSGVLENRYEDVKAILSHLGLPVSPENIAAQLATHPEWTGAGTAEGVKTPAMQQLTPNAAKQMQVNVGLSKPQEQQQPTVIRKLGNEQSNKMPEPNEDEAMAKLFNLK